MKYYSRQMVKPPDLNAHNNLFGGRLLAWLDEECWIYASCQLGTTSVVTKYMSEINFVAGAKQGDIVEFGLQTLKVGRTSITLRAEARLKFSRKVIIEINELVFVCVDDDDRPMAHGKTMATLES
ncbi:MAG: acyl-CoA thioesterase [Gammaproteobacteria bacterium]|nr:MAG: acyl-CoA thioesterase [Gammaproteobacteria bacterium]